MQSVQKDSLSEKGPAESATADARAPQDLPTENMEKGHLGRRGQTIARVRELHVPHLVRMQCLNNLLQYASLIFQARGLPYRLIVSLLILSISGKAHLVSVPSQHRQRAGRHTRARAAVVDQQAAAC